MPKLMIEVSFEVSEVYEYHAPCEYDEDEWIETAQRELLEDFALESWQGEFGYTYIREVD